MRTALLDLDGTLVDSAALITEHLARALTTIGVTVPERAVLDTLVGPPWETALPALGLSPEQTRAAILAYRATYDPVAITDTPVYPGVPGFLERLRDAGLQLALATSKPEHLARRLVAGVGIGAPFTLVGGSDETVGRIGKDKVVASVLDRLGIDPGRDPVIMVGDRHHDVDGAAANGVATIGVGWGYALPGELVGALTIVDELADLEKELLADAIWAGAPAA